LQELLLPTQRNITALYLPGSDLQSIIRTQQWLQHSIDQIELPIVHGTFVLVSTAGLNPIPSQDQDTDLAGFRPTSSTSTSHDMTSARGDVSDSASDSIRIGPADCAAMLPPWRLRQVAAVRVGPGMAPADAQVVLVGGQRVRAGAVADVMLKDVADVEVRFSGCQCCLGKPGREQSKSRSWGF
jgi:hypothetical protein